MTEEKRLEILIELIKLKVGLTEEQIHLPKLERQVFQIHKWLTEFKGLGYLEAITGYGKTWVALFSIYFLNLKYPDATINIVVPTTRLKKDWEKDIEIFGLKNCNVYVVNTYTMNYSNHNCNFLIMDETHHYLSEEAYTFSKVLGMTNFQFVLALSATLELSEKRILEENNINCIDVITKAEGKAMGFISDYDTYNFGIQLSAQEQEEYSRLNDIHNSNFGKFMYFSDSKMNWELARACSAGESKNAKVGLDWKTGGEWRAYYASLQQWDGTTEHKWSPSNISKYAQQWSWAMRERKNFIYNAPSKINAAIEIIKHINSQTITFSETTLFADELCNRLGKKAEPYHSNIETQIRTEEKIDYRKTLKGARKHADRKKGRIGNYIDGKGYPIIYVREYKIGADRIGQESIRKFINEDIQVLGTAKAMDEGADIPNIVCALICSATSKVRQYIQRLGRAIRFVKGKKAFIINLYIKDTQDENWLRRRQRGESDVKWIDNVNQIMI